MKPKLQSTKDYGIFELHPCNRAEHPDKKLAASMAKHGFWPTSPIEVRDNGNGKLRVMRGHHRLAEARRQGLPVWYIAHDTGADIFDAEGSTHPVWSVEDFATAYARNGNRQCDRLISFRNRHGLSMGSACSLVGGESAGSSNKQRMVKEGSFRGGNMEHANEVVAITDLAKEHGVEFATSSGFVAAVSAACRISEFDQEQFKARVVLYPKRMSRRGAKSEYLAEVEALYNYRSKGKRLAVCIRAHEELLKRASVQKK